MIVCSGLVGGLGVLGDFRSVKSASLFICKDPGSDFRGKSDFRVECWVGGGCLGAGSLVLKFSGLDKELSSCLGTPTPEQLIW